MNKAHTMQKAPIGIAPRPLLLSTATCLPGLVLYLSSNYVFESLAAMAYTLYWCLSMVHNIKTGPPITNHKARLIYWALTLSVPSLGLALWVCVTALLALSKYTLGWPASGWAQPSFLVGLPFTAAATMLYLGDVLEDLVVPDGEDPEGA